VAAIAKRYDRRYQNKMVVDLGYAGHPGDAATMILNARYHDTPSIIHDQITTVRAGRTLAYAELTGLEKRDYLFDRGIRPTSYENYRDEGRPDVVSGFVQFSKSALESFANHLLSESLTRVSDELEEPKPKLFHRLRSFRSRARPIPASYGKTRRGWRGSRSPVRSAPSAWCRDWD
jgi:hypothetical protein